MANFEEYKTFLEHIHQYIERRQNVTTTYLAVNTAILGTMMFLFSSQPTSELGRNLAVLGLISAGIFACDFWRRLIIQYSALIGWWYSQMRKIEEELPNSSRLISKEYRDLYQPHPKQVVFGVTSDEIRLTWLFMAVYLILVIVFIWQLVTYVLA